MGWFIIMLKSNNRVKAITVSKIVFQSFITTVPKHIGNELTNIQNTFLMEKLYAWAKT